MFHRSTQTLILVGASLLASVPLLAQQPAAADFPPGPGLELIERACISCHDIYMITSKRKTPDEWLMTLDVMATRGAEVTPDEMQIIGDYLTQHFSTANPEQ
jgi:hypothetical protein